METFLRPQNDSSVQIEEEKDSSAILQSEDGNSRNIIYESHKYSKGKKFNRTAQLGEAIKDAKSSIML